VRRKVTIEALHEFMKELAARARGPGSVYFTGGATALLLGIREQTIDIDLKLDPEPAGVFEAIAELKNRLDLNVELASPDDFIPASKDWKKRSRHITSIGQLQYFHYDFVMQALAKLERGYTQDLEDVKSFLRAGHISVQSLTHTFEEIAPLMVRYPAIDPVQFKAKVAACFESLEKGGDAKR
jgi:hypothetical protein